MIMSPGQPSTYLEVTSTYYLSTSIQLSIQKLYLEDTFSMKILSRKHNYDTFVIFD